MIDDPNDVLAIKLNVRKCPTCGVEAYVIDTREQPDGTIRRRRECPQCGERWSTVELRRQYR